jgi:trans-aconitate 2-methyltransferase
VPGSLDFEIGDVVIWRASEPVDLILANAWQTTYFHILEGEDPVLEWVRGTTLRPVLERLPDGEQEPFLKEYGALLRKAYPMREGKTIFPFKRTFIVAVKRSQ